jgi:hypothetical protein
MELGLGGKRALITGAAGASASTSGKTLRERLPLPPRWPIVGVRTWTRPREAAPAYGHATADPDTIVVEQEVAGASAATGPFLPPNIMVLTARDGEIVRLRDYANP